MRLILRRSPGLDRQTERRGAGPRPSRHRACRRRLARAGHGTACAPAHRHFGRTLALRGCSRTSACCRTTRCRRTCRSCRWRRRTDMHLKRYRGNR
jgi:hypothetical protein